MRIIPSIVFSVIAYFLTGLQRSASQFLIFLVTIFMASVFGSATCFFISAAIPVFDKYISIQYLFLNSNNFHFLAVALIIVVLIFVVMMIFSGFIVELASLFKWLSWIQWISAFRYASNMLTINEFRNITFYLANMTHICPMTGKDVSEEKKLDYKTDWDMWKHFFALSMMSIGFLILAFIQLLRMKKTK